MTEAPDVYPDFPDDDEDTAAVDDGVEGLGRPAVQADPVRTGDARVDDVLDILAGLDDRPVTEHAAVFEHAHDRLRAALDPDRDADRESA